MNIIPIFITSFLLLLSTFLNAAPPIIIGIDKYDPPFIYNINDKSFYGFDIDMMATLCRYMNRECQFKPLNFDEILPSVQNKTVDIGLASLFITPERAQFVDFSIPYLLSYTQFVGRKVEAIEPYSIDRFANKRFGFERGTLFPLIIQSIGIVNPKMVPYNNNHDVISAIQNKEVDYGLFTENAAIYWQSNASTALTLIGKPISYGLGMGIAINKEEPDLLNDINTALIKFQNSGDFKVVYNKYITHF